MNRCMASASSRPILQRCPPFPTSFGCSRGTESLEPPVEESSSSRPRERLKLLFALTQKRWLCCLCLFFAGFLVHTPALRGPFLWDDEYLAAANPLIKSPLLILETFRHSLFLDSFSPHYRPVQDISMMPDYYFWSDNPFGFHLSNMMWHVASGVMLFFLLRRLLVGLRREPISSQSSQIIAFLLALLWIVHPVHSAAVDYISGRADSVAFVFSCAAWLLFLRARFGNSPIVRGAAYAGSFLLGLLALCSRESALLWLAIFLGYQLFFGERTGARSKLAVTLCCVFLAVSYLGLRHLPPARTQTASALRWTSQTRGVLMLRALGDYGRLMVFPSNLHMERSVLDPTLARNAHKAGFSAGMEYLSMLGLGVLGVFAVGSLRSERGRELRVLGMAWFILAYLPTSNLVDLNATVAEHWLYLPSVGFLIFAAGCALAMPRRSYPWAITAACLFAIGLGARSYVRSADWRSAETFFRQTLASGGTSSRAAINLALSRARCGHYLAAESLLRHVLEVSPNDPIARNNLVDVLRHLGRNAEAESLLVSSLKESEKSRHDYPRTWIAAANLARFRHFQKDDLAALAVLDRARAEYPDVWDLIAYEAEILRQTKGPDGALRLVENFARDHWWHYGAALASGRLYTALGDTARAVTALRRASWLDVHEVDALNLMAQMQVRQHRLDDAYRLQRRAVARQPDAPRQYALLSDILGRMGQVSAAQDAIAEGARLLAIGRGSSQSQAN